MTQCIREEELIRWLGGELDDTRQAALRRHFETCAACQERARNLRATWELLGDWMIRPPPQDLAPSVLERASRASESGMPWASVGRLAAAIALAAFTGAGAGLLSSARERESANPPHTVSAEQAAQALGLDVLGGQPAGLSELLVEFDAGKPVDGRVEGHS